MRSMGDGWGRKLHDARRRGKSEGARRMLRGRPHVLRRAAPRLQRIHCPTSRPSRRGRRDGRVRLQACTLEWVRSCGRATTPSLLAVAAHFHSSLCASRRSPSGCCSACHPPFPSGVESALRAGTEWPLRLTPSSMHPAFWRGTPIGKEGGAAGRAPPYVDQEARSRAEPEAQVGDHGRLHGRRTGLKRLLSDNAFLPPPAARNTVLRVG